MQPATHHLLSPCSNAVSRAWSKARLHLTLVFPNTYGLLCHGGNKHKSIPCSAKDIEMQKPFLWDADVLRGGCHVILYFCGSTAPNSFPAHVPSGCPASPSALFATAFLGMLSTALQTCMSHIARMRLPAARCSSCELLRDLRFLPERLRQRHRDQRNQRRCCCQGPVGV